jgi:hypothetical protein
MPQAAFGNAQAAFPRRRSVVTRAARRDHQDAQGVIKSEVA